MAVGIDTNALVRWIVTLPGEEQQSLRARRHIEASTEAIHICLPVLMEAVWLLRRMYRFDRHMIVSVLEALLRNPSVQVAEADSVRRATEDFKAGGAWFADHLIGALNRAAGCKTTLTFDKQAAGLETFTEIA